MINERITELVCGLKSSLAKSDISEATVAQAINDLEAIKDKYKYDHMLFPEIPVERIFPTNLESSPTSLAEALLWKMGKWKIYNEFVANHKQTTDPEKKTDVVFSAFAKHLKDRSKPIYDQHALRALWAIDQNITESDSRSCRATLFNSKGINKDKWKSNMSGKETIVCYKLYVRRMSILCNDNVSHSTLDRLLMPLGQAIKDNVKTYELFERLRNHKNK